MAVDKQLEYWEATKEQHKAGQELLRRLENFQNHATIKTMASYLRAELAEIVALARKAVV